VGDGVALAIGYLLDAGAGGQVLAPWAEMFGVASAYDLGQRFGLADDEIEASLAMTAKEDGDAASSQAPSDSESELTHEEDE
jgi:hypothetical protein